MTIGALGAELLQRRRDGGVELAVGQQQLGLAVLQAEGDQRRIEADVDGIEHRADHRRRVVRLQHGRRVGGEDRHRVAALDAGLGQRMRQLPRAGVELAIGEAPRRHARPRRGRRRTRRRAPGSSPGSAARSWPGASCSSGLSVIVVPHVIPALVAGIQRAACSGDCGSLDTGTSPGMTLPHRQQVAAVDGDDAAGHEARRRRRRAAAAARRAPPPRRHAPSARAPSCACRPRWRDRPSLNSVAK